MSNQHLQQLISDSATIKSLKPEVANELKQEIANLNDAGEKAIEQELEDQNKQKIPLTKEEKIATYKELETELVQIQRELETGIIQIKSTKQKQSDQNQAHQDSSDFR